MDQNDYILQHVGMVVRNKQHWRNNFGKHPKSAAARNRLCSTNNDEESCLYIIRPEVLIYTCNLNSRWRFKWAPDILQTDWYDGKKGTLSIRYMFSTFFS